MNHNRQIRSCAATAFAAAVLSLLPPAWSQDAAPAKEKKPAAAAKPAAGKAAGKPVDLAPPEDPVVTALLAAKPTAPSEVLRTAQLLLEAGRPELAKRFLKKLLDAKLDDAQWTALVDEYHSQAFIDLAERSELRPESEELVRAALGAVNRRLRDPARIAAQIVQLKDPSAEARGQALTALRAAHGAAVSAMIAVLADPQRAGEHATVRAALASMRGDAVDPLADILDRAEPDLMIEAIKALAEMRATASTVYLLAPALSDESDVRVRAAAQKAVAQLMGQLPGKEWAARQLRDMAESYFAGKQPLRTDIDGRVTLWRWDTAAKQCLPRNVSADDAARTIAARLARAARSLAPDDPRLRVLALATALEQSVYDRGLEKRLDFKDPVLRQIAKVNPPTIEGVLAFCLAGHHTAAARAAAEILGWTGNAETALQGGSDPAPLVRAVRSPDPRLRIAALEAIARLKPQKPFAGSSHVLESLAFLAASSGGRRALIVGPTAEVFEEWVGVLRSRNIATDPATTGHEALRMALRSPDYELMLVDMAAQGPLAEDIVQQVRQDYRTASLRIGLIARSGFLERAQRIAEQDPLTIAFSQPVDAEAARWQFGRLMGLMPREFVGFSERLGVAVRALRCLAKLGETSEQLFDLRRAEDAALAGLLVPRLSVPAVAVLADIGTLASQEAMVEVANRVASPLTVRRAAAAAFDLNVHRFGLLLGQGAIRLQYVRYNQSATQNVDSQHVLASLLTTIESRATPSILQAARKAAAQKPKQTPRGGKVDKPSPDGELKE